MNEAWNNRIEIFFNDINQKRQINSLFKSKTLNCDFKNIFINIYFQLILDQYSRYNEEIFPQLDDFLKKNNILW